MSWKLRKVEILDNIFSVFQHNLEYAFSLSQSVTLFALNVGKKTGRLNWSEVRCYREVGERVSYRWGSWC